MRQRHAAASIAAPLCRNSGFDTTAKSELGAKPANDFIGQVVGSDRGRRVDGNDGEPLNFGRNLARGRRRRKSQQNHRRAGMGVPTARNMASAARIAAVDLAR